MLVLLAVALKQGVCRLLPYSFPNQELIVLEVLAWLLKVLQLV